MNICTRCNTELTHDNWTTSRQKSADYCCKDCHSVRWRKYREDNTSSYLLSAAKSRAKRRGIPFDIIPSDIIIPERCPVLGIPLQLSNGVRGPASPSIDRIIPELGYVKGNVVVTSWRANDIKKDATPEELFLLAKHYAPLYF